MSFFFRHIKVSLLLIFLLAAVPSSLYSQHFYPVHATVQVLPPFGLYLSDYYSGTRDRLVVTLLNRDHGQPTLNVRLRVTVRNGNHFLMRSRDELHFPVITLTAGVPFRLTGADLAPYLAPNRVIMQGSLQNGRLPTGMTEFSVQVLDHATGQVLSQISTGRAWLEIHQPPFLNLPSQGEQIAFRTPQHVRFQWMPRHQGVSGTVYEFILRELPDNDVPPQSAFLFGNTIFQTTTRFTTLNLTHLEPLLEPGRRYAWQVRAMAMDGIDEIGMFANHGFSEVGWFQVNDNFPPPMNVSAEAAYRQMTISWQSLPQHQAFVVEYRPKSGQDFFEWTSVETFGSELTVERLNPGWTYEYRVGALNSRREAVFSPVGELTLPERDEERAARCGIAPTIDLSNQEPAESLSPGNVVIIGGDFPMTITEVSSQGNGWFSGRGFVVLPWIFGVEIAVQFNRLRVNTDLRQIDGYVETEFDPTASQVANLNELDYGGRRTEPGRVVFETVRLNFIVPPMPEMEYNPETGELTIYDANGVPHIVQVPRNEQGEPVFPIIIEDAEGNRFKIELPADSEGDGRIRIPVIAMEAGSAVASDNNNITPEELEVLRNELVEVLIYRIETRLNIANFSGKERQLLEGAVNNIERLRTNVTITTGGRQTLLGWFNPLNETAYVRFLENAEEDMKSIILHEFLHFISYLLNIFDFELVFSPSGDTKIPYHRDIDCFHYRKLTMDEVYLEFLDAYDTHIIKLWQLKTLELSSEQQNLLKQRLLEFEKRNPDLWYFFESNPEYTNIFEWPHTFDELGSKLQKIVLEFQKQNNLQEKVCVSGLYVPSNSLREEVAIRRIVNSLNETLFYMSYWMKSLNYEGIRGYEDRIDGAVEFEERNNLNAEGRKITN